VAVNRRLGSEGRVARTSRATHAPTQESNDLLCLFFAYWLKGGEALGPRKGSGREAPGRGGGG